MNNKLDYITRVLRKTKDKRIENYVIGRIWHTLDDYDIKLESQQFVKRNQNKYALTDIYFPQIKLHVEVNEPAHYCNSSQIQADELRRLEIEAVTHHKVLTVDCTGDLEAIHNQVNRIVEYIKSEITTQRVKGSFNPWDPMFENSPEFYQQKGYLAASENVQLKTIEDICKLFNAKLKKRGYLRPGAADHPTDNNMALWWPAKKRQGWENQLTDETVIERHINSERMKDHVNWTLNSQRTKKVVFYKHKDDLGYEYYRFKGVYQLDKENTSIENGVNWKRISDRYTLSN